MSNQSITTSRKQAFDEQEFDLPVSKKARETEASSDTSSESAEQGDDRIQRMAGALKTILEVSYYYLLLVKLRRLNVSPLL